MIVHSWDDLQANTLQRLNSTAYRRVFMKESVAKDRWDPYKEGHVLPSNPTTFGLPTFLVPDPIKYDAFDSLVLIIN